MTYAEILCLAILNIGMPKAHFACDHMEAVVNASVETGIDAEIIISLIHYESNWNPKVVSKANACGLTQVIPKYTKNPRKSCKQLKDPWMSIRTGTTILRRWINKYGRGKVARGLCGYSSGYTCGKRYNRKHGGWRYSRKVLKYAKRLTKQIDYIEDCIELRLNGEEGEHFESGCSC